MIELARRRALAEGLADVRFLRADWEDGGAPGLEDALSASAPTAAVCVSAFHYFADPLEACRRVHRALPPGGRFLVLDREMRGSPMTRAWDFLHRYYTRDHVTFYGSDQIAEVLQDAGFADVRIVSTIRRFLWEGRFYTSLALIDGTKPNA